MLKNKHNLNKKKFFQAFTLAEVLITLGIIGIVAAMTIPTLMNNIQDAQFKTSLKKNYSVLSQAYNLIANDNGGSFPAAFTSCGVTDTSVVNTCFKDIFKTNLNYIKECDGGTALGTCISTQANTKYLNGNPANGWGLSSTLAGLILNDGTSLGIHFGGVMTSGNAWIIIDVNALKPPNTWGRDMFLIYYDTTHIYPASTVSEGVDNCINTWSGHSCAGQYLMGN